ncbi:YqaJ viral recombinase family protein [Pseudomonas luteola]|uniref:YqaJ viral recombinase family nuclease n=1 Tax=Pseudomonas luteola TaxID=47886 RepID=UPI0015E2B4B5|nr:YqaJ viral recombinase family protein [Pseudomonas zeshuii]MBA1250347.1 endonuclease [Pseudomonas zeshuii]
MGYNIINLSQGSDEWLNWRKSGITATDACILLGRSPYKTRWRLWAEKVGYCEEVDLSGNPLVRYGIKHEDDARKAFEDHTGDMLLPVCVESDRNALLRASLDGLNNAGEPVELKCPSDTTWEEVCRLGTESEAYQLYYCQVQHQMLCTGSRRGWLVFWHGNDPLQIFEIPLDRDLLAQLMTEAQGFWQDVSLRNEPPKDPEKDFYLPLGEEASRWIYESEHYRLYEARIAGLKAQIKDLEARQDKHLETMTEMMSDFMKADYAGVQITRFKVQGQIDYKKAIDANPAVQQMVDFEKYRKKTSDRVRVTVREELAPKNVVEASVLAPLEHASAEPESFYLN